MGWLDLIGLVIVGLDIVLVYVHFIISCMIMFVKKTGFSHDSIHVHIFIGIGFSCE